MYQITKGYKQGRGIAFYDLSALSGELVAEKVEKDKVVTFCTQGEISNAKIQWWEGKPIVRLSDKNILLVKIDATGKEAGEIQKVTRTQIKEDDCIDNSKVPESKIVGQINNKKTTKREVVYAGYDRKNIENQVNTKAGVNFSVFNTVGDMVEALMDEFKLRDKDTYRKEVNKKIKLDKPLSSMNSVAVNGIASSLATYFMNMAMHEINMTYLKYFTR